MTASAPRPASSQKKRPKRVSADEAEQLFLIWCEDQSVAALKRASGRNAKTLRDMIRRYDWEGRYKREVLPRVQRKTDSTAADRIADKLKMSGALANAAFAGLFVTDPESGKRRLAVAPTIRDAIAAAKWDEELRDKVGIGEEEEVARVPRELMEQAARVLKAMSVVQIRALGDWIVRNNKSPEGALDGPPSS